MTQEIPGFGEQTLNKIAKSALAKQLRDVEQLEVRIKTNLNKLANGEIDSIAIEIAGLLMPHELRANELQLQIGRVTVKPLSAIRGKIRLTHPSSGVLRLVINENNLTHAINSKILDKPLERIQRQVEEQMAEQIEQVKCLLLADGHMAFSCKIALGEIREAQTVTFTTIPDISEDRKGVTLQHLQDLETKEPHSELVAALFAWVGEILSLSAFERQGTSILIQQLDVTAGQLMLQADIHIEQFPSSSAE